jgi:nucleotide-binding universal stress UspA family protein
MPYKHVLAVYDGSEESEEVLQMACRFTRPERGRMTVLIIRTLPLSQALPVYERGQDAETDVMVQEATKLVDRCGMRAATSVRYARSIGPAVVSESRIHSADLLALAIPDLDKLPSEHTWHSDVRAILRQTSCAVMLIRPGRIEA